MTAQEVVLLLGGIERRLATIADQLQWTREQAQRGLDRINRLRQDLDRVKDQVFAVADTTPEG